MGEKMRRSLLLCFALLLATSVALRAQQKPAPPPASPTSGARMEFLDEVSFYEQRFIRLADAIPAEKYAWHPGEGVRSVGEVNMHVATANGRHRSAVDGRTPAPGIRKAEALT